MREQRALADNPWFLCLLFLLARTILVISIPIDGMQSYGDFWNFKALAVRGIPFFDLWVEFPPLFPFLSRALFLLTGEREHTYIYLLLLIFSMAQAGSIYYFQKLGRRFFPAGEAAERSLVYAFMLVCLFYSWAYFDCLAVFCLLLGLDSFLQGKNLRAGAAIGLGGLLKWFPVLLLPGMWKKSRNSSPLKISVTAVGIIAAAWIALWAVTPDFTRASLFSQGAKGSWETVWAVIDGNRTTGNFAPGIDRTDPDSAYLAVGLPAVISPWLTLGIFGGSGLYVLLKSKPKNEQDFLALFGLTVAIFFLWTPGYSPQWVLYLLPLVLLSLERFRALLISVTLLLLNLLEWPLILSRGWFDYLDELVILRVLVLVLLSALLAVKLLKTKDSGGNLGAD